MYDPRRPQPKSHRRKTELEETRAARALTYLLQGWEGALLTNIAQTDADFRSRVRTAAARVKKDLKAKIPAHATFLAHIAPLFKTTPGAKVTPDGDTE